MAEEQENQIDKRVEKFNRPSQTKPGGAKKLIIPALLVMSGGLLGVSGAAYLVNQNKTVTDTALLPTTSTASEFQTSGLDGLTPVEEAKNEVVVFRDNTEELTQLQETIDDLETQLKELRDNPEIKTVTDETALEKMRDELKAVQKAFKDQTLVLDNRIRENTRLQTQLQDERLMREQTDEEARRRADEQARRRAELERRRTEEEALLQRKINSPIVAYSANGSSNGDVEGSQERYSGDEAFRRAGAVAASVTQSEVIANPSNTVVQGTLIEGTLEMGIISDLAGDVTAVISYDVYSFDMSRVLIPRGSKLYGRYSSDIGVGQKRVLIAWDRILTTDGQSVQISAYGGDRLGRSGLPGKVNNHFFERFGSAALISIIGAAPELAASRTDNEVAQDIAENVGEDFESAVDDVISDYLSIPTTISTDQGAIVMVRVNNDLELF